MNFLLKFSVAAVVFSILSFTSCSDSGTGSGFEDNRIYTGNSIVCYGNSLTEGYGAGDGEGDESVDTSKAYPKYFAQKVNLPVINLGSWGITTEDAADNVENYSEEFTDAKVVIIELGANDLMNKVFEAADNFFPKEIDGDFVEEEVEKSFEKIIEYINGLDGNRKIYLAKFYNRTVANALLKNEEIMYNGVKIPISYDYTFIHKKYEDMFARLKKKYSNVELIEDIWKGIWGKPNLMYDENGNGKLDIDDIHPNAEGYKIMADNYFNAMKDFLSYHNLLK